MSESVTIELPDELLRRAGLAAVGNRHLEDMRSSNGSTEPSLTRILKPYLMTSY